MRAGAFDFAPPGSSQNSADRSLTGSFSSDAFVCGPLRDERNSYRGARDVDDLFVLAASQERSSEYKAIRGGRIGIGRNDANKGDRNPPTAHRYRGGLCEAFPHARAGCSIISRCCSACRNLSLKWRVAITACLGV